MESPILIRSTHRGQSRAGEARHQARLYREAFIRDAYDRNRPLQEIADELGTTVGSIKVSASRMGCSRTPKAAAAFRRGYDVPAHLAADYQIMTRKAGYRAQEAALALGIFNGDQTRCER